MRLLLALGLIFPTLSFSQALTQEVVGSTGEYFEGATHNIVFTIGEVEIENYLGTSHHLTEGFNQCSSKLCSIGFDEIQNPINANLFPNPIESEFALEIPENSENLSISIKNLLGQEVFWGEYNGSTYQTFNISDLAPGSYYLNIISSKGLLKSIKIIKN